MLQSNYGVKDRMTTYIEYQLEDGTTLLIEADEPKVGGVTKASRDKDGNIVKSAGKKFEAALAAVRSSAAALRAQLEELRADEVTVAFGLKTTGEAGNFAIGKVGMEANYTVTLKWSNKESESTGEKKT
jgi:hypothetical protein